MGRGPRPVPRALAVPALASITAIAALASDAEAAQRRATLGLKVTVVGECDAATVAGSAAVALGATCAASLNLPATLVEPRAATAGATAAAAGHLGRARRRRGRGGRGTVPDRHLLRRERNGRRHFPWSGESG